MGKTFGEVLCLDPTIKGEAGLTLDATLKAHIYKFRLTWAAAAARVCLPNSSLSRGSELAPVEHET